MSADEEEILILFFVSHDKIVSRADKNSPKITVSKN
jgi:hypothetical protein